jgi:hypothetical protein
LWNIELQLEEVKVSPGLLRSLNFSSSSRQLEEKENNPSGKWG